MNRFYRPFCFAVALLLGLDDQVQAQQSAPTRALVPQWQALGPLPGAGPRISQLLPCSRDPEHVYAASGAGLLRSTDRGASWSVHAPWPSDSLAFQVVALAPTDPERLALARLGFVDLQMSWDGGMNWWAADTPSDAAVFDVAFDPVDPEVLFAGTREGVWRSTDGGLHFEEVLPTSRLVKDLRIDRNNRGRIYANVSGDGLHVSLDGGNTWVQRSVPGGSYWELAIDPTDGRRVVLAGSGAKLSEDEGRTWLSIGLDAEAVDAVSFDAVDRQRLYAGLRSEGLAISSDGGASWNLSADPGLEHMGGDPIAILPSTAWPGEVLLGGPGGLARSEDGGTTFVRSNDGLDAHAHVLSMAVNPGDDDHLVAKTGGSAFVSLDRGATWTESVTGSAFAGTDVISDGQTPGRFWVGARGKDSGNYELWRSDDGGFTFSVVFRDPTVYFWHLTAHPSLPNVLVGTGRGVQRSDDGGVTFASLGFPSNWVWDLGISPANPNVMYGAATNEVYWSHDGGSTWAASVNPPHGIVRDFQTDPVDPMIGWAVTDSPALAGALFRTDDGGRSWHPMAPGPLAANAVHRSCAHPDLLVLGTFLTETVFASDDGGRTTFDIGLGIRSHVLSFQSTAGELYATSAGHGVYRLR